MVKLFPIIFVLLWSSAFITTKPLVDNSDPFSALGFRFFIVAVGFYIFSVYKNQKIFVSSRHMFESILSGVLFHGFYLGGVFYSISLGLPTGIAALIVTLQPVLTNILAGPLLNEKVTIKQWIGVVLGFTGAAVVLGFDIGEELPLIGLLMFSKICFGIPKSFFLYSPFKIKVLCAFKNFLFLLIISFSFLFFLEKYINEIKFQNFNSKNLYIFRK